MDVTSIWLFVFLFLQNFEMSEKISAALRLGGNSLPMWRVANVFKRFLKGSKLFALQTYYRRAGTFKYQEIVATLCRSMWSPH